MEKRRQKKGDLGRSLKRYFFCCTKSLISRNMEITKRPKKGSLKRKKEGERNEKTRGDKKERTDGKRMNKRRK